MQNFLKSLGSVPRTEIYTNSFGFIWQNIGFIFIFCCKTYFMFCLNYFMGGFTFHLTIVFGFLTIKTIVLYGSKNQSKLSKMSPLVTTTNFDKNYCFPRFERRTFNIVLHFKIVSKH